MKKDKEIIKDFGDWHCPTSWNDVTLKMFSDIERYYSEKDKEFDTREVLHILTNRSVDDINQLPIEFAEMLINKMQFLQTNPKEEKPTNKIVIDGEEYHINFQEKLKTGEYVAVDTVLKGDRHNYAAILAILCRKDDEIYDAKFENEVLPSRIELFEKQSITRVLPIMSFFLHLLQISATHSLLYSAVEELLNHTRQNIETSQRIGAFRKRYLKWRMDKLERSLKSSKNI